MGLSRLFYFQYQSQGQQQELVLPFQDDWFPVNPILVAFGANLKRVRKKLQAYPHEMIAFVESRGNPTMCLTPDSIDKWLLSLNPNYYAQPELIKHFQKFLVRCMKDFLEEVKRDQEREELEQQIRPLAPNVEVEYMSYEEALAFSGFNTPIYLDKPLTKREKFRLFLNQMGLTKWEYIKYAAEDAFAIELLRIKPGTEDEIEERSITGHNMFNAHEMASSWKRNGWDVEPVFYVKYPELYTRKVQVVIQAAADTHIAEMVRVPFRRCPWFQPEDAEWFRQLAKQRKEVHWEMERKRIRQELEQKMLAARAEQQEEDNDDSTADTHVRGAGAQYPATMAGRAAT